MDRFNPLKWKRVSEGALLDVSRKKQSYSLHPEEPCLKWLAFSATLLPVFIASPSLSSVVRRVASTEILSNSRIVSQGRRSSLEIIDMPSSTDAVYDGYGRETTDAFHATLLWEKIVIHLERTVRCARRSQGLKSYEDCFHGSKAVDVLLDYLNAILPTKTVKRAQTRTLCQQLLNTEVFEDVRSKDKCVFRENRLYRFTGNHFWEPTELDHIPRSRSVEDIACNRGEVITAAPKLNAARKLRLEKGYTSDSTVTASSHKRQRAVTSDAHRSLTTKERFSSVFQCARPNPEPKLKIKAPSPVEKPNKKEKSRGAAGLIKRKVSFLVQRDMMHTSQEIPRTTTSHQTPVQPPRPSKSRFENALKDRKNIQTSPRHLSQHRSCEIHGHIKKDPKPPCEIHGHQRHLETPVHFHREAKTLTPHSHTDREQRTVRHKQRSRRHERKSPRHDSSHRIARQHSKHSFGSLSDETDSSGKWVVYGYV